MTQSRTPSSCLLIGSIFASSTEEAFTTVCSALPGRLFTLPDGEIGDRYNYIGWQRDCFPKETLQLRYEDAIKPEKDPILTLDSIRPTRYDEVAINSYGKFLELRATGTIPQDVRFQVSLPTPYNSVQAHTRNEFHENLEPLYEHHFQAALARIVQEIPEKDLAIQWDMCFDVAFLEYERGRLSGQFFKPHFVPIREGILDRLSRLCAFIPFTVQLGFHLCYGDMRRKHFVEPVDTALLVGLANDIAKRLTRPISWVHMPVPKERRDAAYYKPLNQLDIGSGRLYLGLVHPFDEEGTRQRILIAQSVFPQQFGIATECGMGRTSKKEVDSILQTMREVSTEILS